MIKEIKKEYLYLMFILGLFMAGNIKTVYADPSGTGDGFFENPLGADSISVLVAKLLDFIAKIGAIIAVFFIIYAGFLFVTARGSEEKITKAKVTLYWTVIGALILIGAKVLGEVVCNTATELGAAVPDCTAF